MTKRKVGLVLFWIGVIWAIAWGNGGYFQDTSLTMEELNQTIWAPTGPLFMLWGVGVPLGGIVTGIGLLLYSGAKGSTVWKVGIGLFIAFVISLVPAALDFYSPPLFGIGGTLILLSFTGILWLWAKERIALKGSSTTAADFKLVGYVFMLIAAWFTCGAVSFPYSKALEGQPPQNPTHVMIFFVLGWLFLLLGHYQSRKQQGSAGPSGVAN